MTDIQPLILAEVRNRVGHLTINRPAAYNAINLEAVRQIQACLEQWAADDNVVAVVLRGSGDKAFCAGGDIRELYDNHQQGSPLNEAFFREEYRLDQYIHDYPKPLLALAEGLVLGGGMGLFQGAAFRVVTSQARLGMPEVSIGYFPDVGGSYFLSRLAGELGTCLAVTGNMIGAEDALYTGLADWLIAGEQVAELDRCLDQMDWQLAPQQSIRSLLATLASPASKQGELEPLRGAIDRHFAFDWVPDILQSLAGEQDPSLTSWAHTTIETLRSRSPLAMATTLQLLRRGRGLSLQQCFAMELQLIARWFEQGDFIEGVRALIVDKDKNPRWKYSSTEEVPQAEVDALFAGISLPGIQGT